jgi:hypothetical protein
MLKALLFCLRDLWDRLMGSDPTRRRGADTEAGDPAPPPVS